MKCVIAVLCLAVLTACGADGEPVQPTMNTGIGITPDGVKVRTGVGVKAGLVNLGLGLGL
ncbi:MAG: argininosuccinate lyase [Pseudomonadota bacterium]